MPTRLIHPTPTRLPPDAPPGLRALLTQIRKRLHPETLGRSLLNWVF